MRILFATAVVILKVHLGASSSVADADRPLTLLARSRVAVASVPGLFDVRETSLAWKPAETAIVICDMWDIHWCQSATRRVGEMAPRMNAVVAAARASGVLIVHSPSECMSFYKDWPQRKRAQTAPTSANAPKHIDLGCRRLEGEPNLPIDDSDGGCDDQAPSRMHNPWRRQIDAIAIDKADAISDSGREQWNLFEERGIRNVILMGVHTNMCVVGRPFGLRQWSRSGKNVVLARDLTDSMYNPKRAPFVCHRRGTELVIEHIEKYICASVDSGDLIGERRQPTVVIVAAEDRYDSEASLADFAERELKPRGVHVELIAPSRRSLDEWTGLEPALAKADLLVLSARRRTPRASQLTAIREYLEAGRPMVAMRTSSHAFASSRGAPADGFSDWPSFDADVLGAKYQGHYPAKPPGAAPTSVQTAPGLAGHPVLREVGSNGLQFSSALYKMRDANSTITVLWTGHATGDNERFPVAWTNTYKGGRIVYTSLGSREDFSSPDFRKLLVNAMFFAMERQH